MVLWPVVVFSQQAREGMGGGGRTTTGQGAVESHKADEQEGVSKPGKEEETS